MELSFTEQEQIFVKDLAEIQGLPVTELLRQWILERMEEEEDLKSFYEAKEEFQQNPVTYTLEEVQRDLGLL